MRKSHCIGFGSACLVSLLLAETVCAQTAQPRPNPGNSAGYAQGDPAALPSAPGPAPSSSAPVQPVYQQPQTAQPATPPATAVPGQYVVIDPANGGHAPMVSYAPIIRERPQTLPYVEGAPIPRGYMLEEYHPNGLIIAGAITFGVLYTFSLTAAASDDYKNGNGWLAVPVIGPFGWLAARKSCDNNYGYSSSCSDESTYRTWAMLDGLGQVAGASMLIAGLAITRKRLVLVDQDVIIAPYASSTGSGLRLMGRF